MSENVKSLSLVSHNGQFDMPSNLPLLHLNYHFLALLDNCFPPNNPLHKLFTRQTVKLSYKRMPNMAQAVSGHNAKLLRDDRPVDEQPGCNCRGGPTNCPVGGKCLTNCVVYEAKVTEQLTGNSETYTGVTSRPFKQRLYEHHADMRKEESRTKSRLCSHIWDLKDKGTVLILAGNWKIGQQPSILPQKSVIFASKKSSIFYTNQRAPVLIREVKFLIPADIGDRNFLHMWRLELPIFLLSTEYFFYFPNIYV